MEASKDTHIHTHTEENLYTHTNHTVRLPSKPPHPHPTPPLSPMASTLFPAPKPELMVPLLQEETHTHPPMCTRTHTPNIYAVKEHTNTTKLQKQT